MTDVIVGLTCIVIGVLALAFAAANSYIRERRSQGFPRSRRWHR